MALIYLSQKTTALLVWKWQKTWAVRKGNWKLTNAKENHWKSEPSAQYISPIRDDLTLKLFNIEEDPGERNDLASIHPEIVRDLEAAFKNWCESNIK